MRRLMLGLFLAALAAASVDARGSHGGFRSHAHYSYAGGWYAGGRGSSHKGGHYVNPFTGNHYRHHVH